MARKPSARAEDAQPQSRAAEDAEPALDLSDHDFAQVASFRATLRRLLRQTELEAHAVGLTPQHYHLMLAIKGFPGREWANISELAERLQIRHNAVIGLVKRAVVRGLVARHQGIDRRTVRVTLTPEGERVLSALVLGLRDERQRLWSAVEAMTGGVDAPLTPPPETPPHPV